MEVEIETNRKNHQPREGCDYSIISYSENEITGTVLIGGFQLSEEHRLKWGSSDIDIFIWGMLFPFNYFSQDD